MNIPHFYRVIIAMITALEKFGDIFVSWYVVNLETDLINRD